MQIVPKAYSQVIFPQITPASSWCVHWLEAPRPKWLQSIIDVSLPVQSTWSNHIFPFPWPKLESPGAALALERPSILQMTVALFKLQLSSQIVPQIPFTPTSTLPSVEELPPTKRISTEAKYYTHIGIHVNPIDPFQITQITPNRQTNIFSTTIGYFLIKEARTDCNCEFFPFFPICSVWVIIQIAIAFLLLRISLTLKFTYNKFNAVHGMYTNYLRGR